MTEMALILRHLAQGKEELSYNNLNTLCQQSKHLRPWTLTSSVSTESVLWAARQRATVEMLGPASPFTLRCLEIS